MSVQPDNQISDTGLVVAYIRMMQIMEDDVDILGIAKECGAVIHDSRKAVGSELVNVVSATFRCEDDLESFASRLTADKDAEIDRLNGLVAMQAEALRPFANFHCNDETCECNNCKAHRLLSASSDTVSAYKREVQAEALEDAADWFHLCGPNGASAKEDIRSAKALLEMASELRAKVE